MSFSRRRAKRYRNYVQTKLIAHLKVFRRKEPPLGRTFRSFWGWKRK
jgi:hypothetical protein